MRDGEASSGDVILNSCVSTAEALNNLTRAIELQPEDGTNYYWHACTHFQIKNYVKALNGFTKAIELQPEDAEASYIERVRAYEAMGEWGCAQKELENIACKFVSFRWSAAAESVICLMRLGKTDDAENKIKSLLLESPQNKSITCVWMNFLGWQNRWKELIEIYYNYENLEGNDTSILENTDRVKIEVGDDAITG